MGIELTTSRLYSHTLCATTGLREALIFNMKEVYYKYEYTIKSYYQMNTNSCYLAKTKLSKLYWNYYGKLQLYLGDISLWRISTKPGFRHVCEFDSHLELIFSFHRSVKKTKQEVKVLHRTQNNLEKGRKKFLVFICKHIPRQII